MIVEAPVSFGGMTRHLREQVDALLEAMLIAHPAAAMQVVGPQSLLTASCAKQSTLFSFMGAGPARYPQLCAAILRECPLAASLRNQDGSLPFHTLVASDNEALVRHYLEVFPGAVSDHPRWDQKLPVVLALDARVSTNGIRILLTAEAAGTASFEAVSRWVQRQSQQTEVSQRVREVSRVLEEAREQREQLVVARLHASVGDDE
eukprot:2101006-Prymnesium_polylepis.1